jgi:hypothetical protein
MTIKIKNWSKFQHFKDRRPPWIKLHRDILEQRDITLISDCSFRVLVGLWLLASEDEDMQGGLPDIDDISFRLRIDKSKVTKALSELEPWLDINVTSDRYQSDAPETETETETEVETYIPPTIVEVSGFNEWYDSYPRKIGKKAAEKAFNSAIKSGVTIEQLTQGVAAYNQEIKDAGTSTQYIKHPSTWINQGCYDDDHAQIVHDNAGRDNKKPRSIFEIGDEVAARMGWE